MDQLRSFGYPMPGDNVFIKPASFSAIYGLSSVGFVSLFTLQPDQVSSNKSFPLSGSQIVAINEIKFTLTAQTAVSANYSNLCKSYFQILRNGKELFKVPLISLVKSANSLVLGNSTKMNFTDGFQSFKKRLKFPIIINSKDEISFRIYSTFSGQPVFGKVTLIGVTYDKTSNFDKDFRQDNQFEKIDYSLYDVFTIDSTSAKTYSLFNTQGKSENLFSKGLSLSNDEVFQVENIRLIGRGGDASDISLSTMVSSINYSLILSDEQRELINLKEPETINLILSQTANTVNSGADTYTIVSDSNNFNNGFTLPVPVILKANSNNSASLILPSLTAGVSYGYLANDFFVVMLNGTLTRKVS